jgi:hypothetical protein
VALWLGTALRSRRESRTPPPVALAFSTHPGVLGAGWPPVKSPCRKKNQNFDKKFDVSFSPTFFVLSRFRVFFSDGSSKTLQKTFYKKIVSKSFYKKFDQKSKTDFFSNCFLSRFWAFLDEGS